MLLILSDILNFRISTVYKGFTPATSHTTRIKGSKNLSSFKTPCNRPKFSSTRASSGLFTPFPTSGMRTGSVRLNSTTTPSVEAPSIIVGLFHITNYQCNNPIQ